METEHKTRRKEPVTGQMLDDEKDITDYGEQFPDKSESGDEVYDVLIVDDETQILKLLKESLKASKALECDVTLATDGKYGLKHINEKDYDLVLSDYNMPEVDGLEFLKQVKEDSPDTVRIMITGQGCLEVAKEAINEADVHHFIEKPWDTKELISIVRRELKGKEKSDGEEWIPDVNSVEEAIEAVESLQKKVSQNPKKTLKKDMMMLEFDSNEEFNKFSFEIKSKKNIEIEDVNIFQDKYVLAIGILPKCYETIK
ncbi:MAG: response regulator [Candidatus Natronoplasma sp.]